MELRSQVRAFKVFWGDRKMKTDSVTVFIFLPICSPRVRNRTFNHLQIGPPKCYPETRKGHAVCALRAHGFDPQLNPNPVLHLNRLMV